MSLGKASGASHGMVVHHAAIPLDGMVTFALHHHCQEIESRHHPCLLPSAARLQSSIAFAGGGDAARQASVAAAAAPE